MEEILGAHPMDDDDFLGNTNPTDVLIDTADSEEMMTGSHITEFYTLEHEEPVTAELLNKVANVQEVTCKHGVGQEHHNQSNLQSTKSANYKLPTCKDESFPFNTIKEMETLLKLLETLLSWRKDLLVICSLNQGT